MKCLLCEKDAKINQTYQKNDLVALWLEIFPDINEEIKSDDIHLFYCSNCNLKFFDPVLAGGDKFYSELGKLEWYYNHPGKTEYDFVQKYINDNNKVLDIGSGSGVLFQKINNSVEYTGLELSTKAVSIAQEMNINVIQEDIESHSLKNKKKYDIVCLFQVIEHLTVLDSFIKSIYDVLKDDGLFVIATPNNDGFYSITPNLTFNLPPHHTIHWTEKSLRYLANKYNFEIVESHLELLQTIHQDIAVKSYISYNLSKLFFIPNLLINNTYIFNLVDTATNIIFHNPLFKRLFFQKIIRKIKYGQSIIIVLKKKF